MDEIILALLGSGVASGDTSLITGLGGETLFLAWVATARGGLTLRIKMGRGETEELCEPVVSLRKVGWSCRAERLWRSMRDTSDELERTGERIAP